MKGVGGTNWCPVDKDCEQSLDWIPTTGDFDEEVALFFFALAILSMPLLASAQRQFAGTRKFDVKGGDKPVSLIFTFKVNGNEIEMTTPKGLSYRARLDGGDAPMIGDPDVTSASIKMKDKDALQETFKHNGEVVQINRMKVSPSGKTMTIVNEDKLKNTTGSVIATRQ